MQKLERVLHTGAFELFRGDDDFARGKSEFCVFAGGFCPFAFSRRHELDAESDCGNDIHFPRNADDLVHFFELLDNDDRAFPEAATHQREADVFFVFIAVADEERVFAFEQGEGDEKFGFRAGFQPVIVIFSGIENFFDDFAELVDFNRENTAVNSVVGFVLNRCAKRFVQLDDAGTQQILHADGERRAQPHGFRFLDDVHNANVPQIAHRVYIEKTVFIDGKMRSAPALEAVILLRFVRSPRNDGIFFAHDRRLKVAWEKR